MPAYLVAVYSYHDRAAAKSARDLIDRDAADNATDGAPSRIVATSVHDTPPVVLAGLVRGGEISTKREWLEVEWNAAEYDQEILFVAADGRACQFVRDAEQAIARGALPITWYTYPEAP